MAMRATTFEKCIFDEGGLFLVFGNDSGSKVFEICSECFVISKNQ